MTKEIGRGDGGKEEREERGEGKEGREGREERERRGGKRGDGKRGEGCTHHLLPLHCHCHYRCLSASSSLQGSSPRLWRCGVHPRSLPPIRRRDSDGHDSDGA